MKNSRSGEKIKLTSIDELLGVVNEESAMEIEIKTISPFKGHPFKVIADDKMEELINSVKESGVITPVLLRPAGENHYEMISGHRRMYAARKAGLSTVPAIVRDMTDDEAVIAMVDANIQREELLPSEKAFAYKMKLNAMKRQAGRPSKNNSGQNDQNLSGAVSRDILAEQVGESSKQIQRYIRLTELIPELLDMVDNKKLQFTVAVDISYIDKEMQKWIYEYIKDNGFIKPNQIAVLRKRLEDENIGHNYMISIHEVSGPLYAESWDDVREWLDQRMLTEPLDKERIGRVLHPEQFDKTSEQMMFEMTGTRFSLYQIPADSPGWAYKFTGIEALQKQGLEVKASDYECVYSGQMLPSDNLDTLYSMFNDNYPADFKSHSLSVSDVIVTNQGAELHSYYIDSFGFTELPDFAAQRQEILGITQEDLRFDILNDSDCISFYTAECSEFPVMGECHTGLSLEDAFEKYDQIPGERMNGVKCIGFDLQDGSEWSGMFPLVTGNSIDKELINSIPGFRDNRLVQRAMERAEKLLEERNHEKNILEKREEKQRGNEAPKRKRREDVSL